MPKEENLPINVKEALASIENLSNSGGSSLDLSHKGLSAGQLTILIPEIKKKLPNLKGIDLSNNNLDELPAEISQLNHLVSIHLISNNLSQLPDELFNIPNLGGIFLEDNNLTTIPKSIIELHGIYDLSLNGNPISQETIAFLERSFTGAEGWFIYDLPCEKKSRKNEQEVSSIIKTSNESEASDLDGNKSDEEIKKKTDLKELTKPSNEKRSAKRRKPNPSKSLRAIAKGPQSHKW